MKAISWLITLLPVVVASPVNTTGRIKRGCTNPGTYRCATDKTTMEVCDWDGTWKRLTPGCQAGTECQKNPYGNNIPYCVATPVNPTPTPPGGNCNVIAQYTCFRDAHHRSGIQVCDLSNHLQTVGMCPNYCAYIAGIPYCF